MSRSSSSSFAGGVAHAPPLFTVSQWAEMDHQAMVFKYLNAGVPVPPELLAPLRSSLIFPHFLPHPSLTYASFCGKKMDPEPGRCRRTDGKKWRCSKEAHLDSKYCERHMNRGHYRSRKLVESQNAAAAAAAKSLLAAAASEEMRSEGRGNGGTFGNVPLGLGGSSGMQLAGNSGSICFGSDATQLRMESIPYGIVKHGNRVFDGAEEHNFMLEASGSTRSVGVDRTVDDPWRLMTSRVPSNSSSESRNDCFLLNNNSQLQTVQDSERLTVDVAMAKQQQQQYDEGEFGVLRSVKQDQNSLQPFFDEWPKSRELGLDHSDLGSNTTQLSMSNQMAPSFFKER